MAGGYNGYRAVLVRRQLTPGLISSLPETAGLPPFISFSTSYHELDSAVSLVIEESYDKYPVRRPMSGPGTAVRARQHDVLSCRHFDLYRCAAAGISQAVPATRSRPCSRTRRQVPTRTELDP
jgi:hypothetical protein